MAKHFHTCRICKHVEYEDGQPNVSQFPFIRYGTRHWAHADCGMKKHGMEFLQGLSTGQVEGFPFMACIAAGLPGAISAELNRRSQMQWVARETWKVPNVNEDI